MKDCICPGNRYQKYYLYIEYQKAVLSTQALNIEMDNLSP